MSEPNTWVGHAARVLAHSALVAAVVTWSILFAGVGLGEYGPTALFRGGVVIFPALGIILLAILLWRYDQDVLDDGGGGA